MDNYFDNFPTTVYTFDPKLQVFKTVVDIFCRVKFLNSIINNISIFDTYDIRDGDTPESIAFKLYADPTRSWIILYANLILDRYYQWPLTVDQFNANMETQFGGIVNAQSTLHHIEKHTNIITTENYKQTLNTYISIVNTDVIAIDGQTNLPTIQNPVIQIGSNTITYFGNTKVDTSVQLIAISNYDYSYQQNENNRTIKLIDPQYANQIVTQFKQLLAQ